MSLLADAGARGGWLGTGSVAKPWRMGERGGEGGGVQGQLGLEVNPNARYSSNTAARSQQGLHGQFSKIILLEKKFRPQIMVRKFH